MRVTCEKCDRAYDDAQRWTICPHNRLEASPDGDGRGEHGGGYCERHDLFNCPFHLDEPPAPPRLPAGTQLAESFTLIGPEEPIGGR